MNPIGGSITGNAATATTATHLAGGALGSIPYQSLANTTTFLASIAGDNGKVLKSNGGAAPSWETLTKGDVGLGSVDNTSDASKPISTATQAALDLKAPLASPSFTGTVNVSSLSASLPVKTDGSKNLVSGAISLSSATEVTGILPVGKGGTGSDLSAGGASGDLMVANSATTFSRLADVAVGRVLTSGGVGSLPVYTSTPTLGVAGTTLGTLTLAGNTSGVVTISPQAAAGTYNFNLPTSAGTSGQVLASNGGGANAMSWLTIGGVASLTSTSGAINTIETSIISFTIPANTLKAGSTFRIRASGTCTSSFTGNISDFRIRIGANGNSSDNEAITVTPTSGNGGTNIPFVIEEMVTIRTIGAGGTMLGSGVLNVEGTNGVATLRVVADQATSAAAINTTVSNIIHLSFESAAATTTCTFYNAIIEVVKP
jgi:hypothetical protein